MQRMEVPPFMAALQATKVLPPLAIAYLSHVDGVTRWPESLCSPDFAKFIRSEAAPFAAAQFPILKESTPRILGGLSLTGLSATHAALMNPNLFAGVFSQSASFWWNEMQLVADVAAMPPSRTRFRVVCGSRETIPYIEHGPGLVQRVSQLASNLAMRDALLAGGFNVDYAEYDGGHDLGCWKEDLPRSLAAIL